MTATLVLVRHGETNWNRERRFQGHADPPLNELGRAQSRELARALAGEPLSVAYTSPLRRAFETAAILGGALGIEVLPEPALMEVDVGSWSGLTRPEIEARFPHGYRRWLERGHGWDDGETYEELGARVVAGLLEIGARHRGETVLAVTHGGPIRSALAAVSGTRFTELRRSPGGIENCAVVRLAVRDGGLHAVD